VAGEGVKQRQRLAEGAVAGGIELGGSAMAVLAAVAERAMASKARRGLRDQHVAAVVIKKDGWEERSPRV
jgi:hypothetical protein